MIKDFNIHIFLLLHLIMNKLKKAQQQAEKSKFENISKRLLNIDQDVLSDLIKRLEDGVTTSINQTS